MHAAKRKGERKGKKREQEEKVSQQPEEFAGTTRTAAAKPATATTCGSRQHKAAFISPSFHVTLFPKVIVSIMSEEVGSSITVYIKAGPDGKARGSCPFCQKVMMFLKMKGIEATEHPVDMKNKPQWFLDMTASGTVPVMKYGDTLFTDSDEIIKFIQEKHPEPDVSSSDEAMAVGANAFSAFRTYFKNKVRLI